MLLLFISDKRRHVMRLLYFLERFVQDIEFKTVLDYFKGRSFSTFQFANQFNHYFPDSWKVLVNEYGNGGKGAGKHYTVFSRIAHYLNQRSNHGELNKLDYRSAPPEWGSPVIRYWTEDKLQVGGQNFPEEIVTPEGISEGAKTSIIVNRYERNSKAKGICIEKWGIRCFVCGFDFEETYGAIGAGFIHVHHLKPIAEIGEEYELNPEEDLRPLCPNCHSMVHRKLPIISIEELKALIE